MAAPTLQKQRLTTGVFTDEELDYFYSLGPGYFAEEETERVGECDFHYLSVSVVFQLLQRVFPEPSDVHIAANNFIYWDRTQKGLVVCPDLYIVKGAGRRIRRIYKLWEEGGRTPDIVFEFASDKTWNIDLTTKKAIYERDLRASEYFLFDPMGGRYPEKLQGFRLRDGAYEPIPLIDGRLYSEQLDLHLYANDLYLRFFDRKRNEVVPTPEEARESAEEAREIEAEGRRQAEAEVARLREELEAIRQQLAG